MFSAISGFTDSDIEAAFERAEQRLLPLRRAGVTPTRATESKALADAISEQRRIVVRRDAEHRADRDNDSSRTHGWPG